MARSRLLSPSAFLRRGAIYKGLLGGQRNWLAVGGVLWGFRFIRKTFGKSETIVATEVLKPGQFASIQAIRPDTRRDRRRARRTAG